MIGDSNDMAGRLRTILPAGWFGEADATPILTSLLLGLGTGFSSFWLLLQSVIAQTRIRTAYGNFLDMISADFFDAGLVRLPDEQDDAFRTRILEAILRPRATRAAVTLALTQLTGHSPIIFEPANTADTGGYSVGGIGYGAGEAGGGGGGGGWGSLALPFQFFITVFRSSGGGISEIAGYGSGGVPVYGSLSMETAGLPDRAIIAAVPPLLPAATTAWMRLAG
jgi:hypothetical protein